MKDITAKDDKALKALEQELQGKLREFRFNVAGSQVRNVREGRQLRRDLARIATEFGKRATKA